MNLCGDDSFVDGDSEQDYHQKVADSNRDVRFSAHGNRELAVECGIPKKAE